jgi:hypothetical protein
VVDFLELGEYHGHAIHEKGINHLVSQIHDGVCRGLAKVLVDFLCHSFHNLYVIKLGNNAKVVFL